MDIMLVLCKIVFQLCLSLAKPLMVGMCHTHLYNILHIVITEERMRTVSIKSQVHPPTLRQRNMALQ